VPAAELADEDFLGVGDLSTRLLHGRFPWWGTAPETARTGINKTSLHMTLCSLAGHLSLGQAAPLTALPPVDQRSDFTANGYCALRGDTRNSSKIIDLDTGGAHGEPCFAAATLVN